MTDIDLTHINEAAARALFAEDLADRCVRRLPEIAMSAAEKEEAHRYFFNYALSTWDRATSNEEEVLRYRKLAHVVTHSLWKDVARQAWDNCRNTIREETQRAGTFWMGNLTNPYGEGQS